MADISPIGSIMEAMAMGAMMRMVVTSILANRKGCRPTALEVATEEKSTRGFTAPEASLMVAPQAFAMTATR